MSDRRLLSVIPLPILSDPDLSDAGLRVACAIGAFMDRGGTCAPGIENLCQQSRRTQSTVYRGVSELIERGHLTVKRRHHSPSELRWKYPVSHHNETSQFPSGGKWPGVVNSQKRGSQFPTGGNLPPSQFPAGDRSITRTAVNENFKREETARLADDSNSNENGHSEQPGTPSFFSTPEYLALRETLRMSAGPKKDPPLTTPPRS